MSPILSSSQAGLANKNDSTRLEEENCSPYLQGQGWPKRLQELQGHNSKEEIFCRRQIGHCDCKV